MRAALACQQAQEVPEDERWAVQVRWQAGRRQALWRPGQGIRACAVAGLHRLRARPPACWPAAGPPLAQGTAARRYWSCPGTADLRVRGRGYLQDKRKIPAAMPMFDLYS